MQPDTLTTDTLENDQKERWGFEPGAVDTLEMDLTQNGASAVDDRTFHAVFRPSMGPNTMTSSRINEENQAVEQSAEQVEEEGERFDLPGVPKRQSAVLDFLRREPPLGPQTSSITLRSPRG